MSRSSLLVLALVLVPGFASATLKDADIDAAIKAVDLDPKGVDTTAGLAAKVDAEMDWDEASDSPVRKP